MASYRVIISYKGTHFHGWQALAKEARDAPFPTVQGTIKEVLLRISRQQDCSISATSRTDAGVHAQGQLGKIRIPKEIPPAILQRGMNSLLPDSIRIVACECCSDSFNPKTLATRKTYRYLFSMQKVASPMLHDIVAQVQGPLRLSSMQQAAQAFVGQHDFRSYCPPSAIGGNSIRSVVRCEVFAVPAFGGETQLHCVEVCGKGFLKYMVRHMCGTLFALSRGEISTAQIVESLAGRSSDKLATKASAKGLSLVSVEEDD